MRKLLFALVGFIVLSSCATKTSIEDSKYHRIELLANRMDSIVSKIKTVSQDSTFQQTFFRELQSIKENNDTSHYVVVDTAGNVIKEKTVITKIKEVTNEKEREQLTIMSHRLEVMDSTLSVMKAHVERSDSLLSVSKKETVKEVVKIPKIYTVSLIFSILVVIFAIFKVIRWFRV